MKAGGAVKARVPVKPVTPSASNQQPFMITELDPTEDRSMTEHENAGYMLAGA